MPIGGEGASAWFNLLQRPLPPGKTPPAVPYRVVTADYFRTLGIPLVRGRLLADGDGLNGTPSVLISESVAKRFWPDASAGDPLGAEIYLGAPDYRLFPSATIVGVVKDVKLAGLDSGLTEAVYGLQSLMPFWPSFAFVVRTSVEPSAIAAAVRHEIRQVDATLPITELQTMEEALSRSVGPARASMLLLTLFAGLALLMAGIGVFGVLSYMVSRRSHEMGIRLALGAEPASLRRLVVRQGMKPIAGGMIVGLIAAFWLTELMSALLFEVPARDPVTFAAACVVLAVAALLACYLPARRATRVDPLLVLRA